MNCRFPALFLVLSSSVFCLGSHPTTTVADFAHGVGVDGWTCDGSSFVSPRFEGEIVSVSPSCTGLGGGGEVRVIGRGADSYTLECSGGASVASVSTVWMDPHLPVPTGLWVTNVFPGAFTAWADPVDGAAGYRLTMYTNVTVGASAGQNNWIETFDAIATTTSTSTKLTDSHIKNADNPTSWSWNDSVYLSSVAGTVRVGKSEGGSGELIASGLATAGGTHLRLRASRYGKDEGQNLRVSFVCSGVTGAVEMVELKSAMADYYLPLSGVGAFDAVVLKSVPASSSKDARTLVDCVALVTGYEPGVTERVEACSWFSEVPRFGIEGAFQVEASLAVRAVATSGGPDLDSPSSDCIDVDLFNPLPMPMSLALKVSECAAAGYSYAPDFSVLPDWTESWYSGSYPLRYWVAETSRGAAVTAYGKGGANTATSGMFHFTSADSALGCTLGVRCTSDDSFYYGFALYNDTEHPMIAFTNRFDAVQWGFKNSAAQTISCEWRVADELVDISAPGDWTSVDGLAFTTTGTVDSKPSGSDCLVESKEGGLGDSLKLFPGKYLLIRFVAPKMSTCPGTGISNYRLTFNTAAVGTALFLR